MFGHKTEDKHVSKSETKGQVLRYFTKGTCLTRCVVWGPVWGRKARTHCQAVRYMAGAGHSGNRSLAASVGTRL